MIEQAVPLLVVAAAMVDADGRVLVQQRPVGKQHAGLWEFPGGKVEPGETAEGALVRELAEELGITADHAALTPLAFATSVHEEGARPLILLLYRVARWSGMPAPLAAAALAWHAPAAMAGLPMPPADRALALAIVGRDPG